MNEDKAVNGLDKVLVNISNTERSIRGSLVQHTLDVTLAAKLTNDALCRHLAYVDPPTDRVVLEQDLVVRITKAWASQYFMIDECRGWSTLISFVYDVLEGSSWHPVFEETSNPSPHRLHEKPVVIVVERNGSH